jgi:predicted alpha/beta hydrolase family esterase
MKNAIILHGMPDKEEYLAAGERAGDSHWYHWLKHMLELQGIESVVPEMPTPYEPHYATWREAFERYSVNEHTILVGHSCGAGFIIRWLSENKITVGKVILVAPWIDPDREFKNLVADFFDFTMDPELIIRTQGITIFYSTDDTTDIIETVEIIEKTIPKCVIKKFEDKGHFTLEDMKTEEFPELLVTVL